MKLAFQRWIDRHVGSLICRLLSALPSRKRPSHHTPRKILVILLSEMGSLVLAYPMFRRLQEKYPEASLYVLLFDQNKEVLELLDILPGHHMLTLRNNSFLNFATDSLTALRAIRRLKIDTVIDCELFARISSIFSRLSGASLRVGFHPYRQEGLYRGAYINRPIPYNPYHHISKQFLAMAESIESNDDPPVKRLLDEGSSEKPAFLPFASEVDKLRERLRSDFPDMEKRRLLLIYPSGGILPIRAWPVNNFADLARRFAGEGYAVAVIGLPQDKSIAREIIDFGGSDYIADFTGYTRSIRELLTLFTLSSLLVTNDGGPGQFAALTKIPTIILFGPETPALYGSLSDRAIFLHRPLPCSPCLTAYNHRNSPCNGDNQCLKQIGAEEVYREARRLLATEEGN
ncbi:MAG: glycosyltransferase family 9 protein [Deltaproteobacteria bacterium]|nr:glycosyltransferase family 9 protein [Deltaproteobacteria bacterium]